MDISNLPSYIQTPFIIVPVLIPWIVYGITLLRAGRLEIKLMPDRVRVRRLLIKLGLFSFMMLVYLIIILKPTQLTGTVLVVYTTFAVGVTVVIYSLSWPFIVNYFESKLRYYTYDDDGKQWFIIKTTWDNLVVLADHYYTSFIPLEGLTYKYLDFGKIKASEIHCEATPKKSKAATTPTSETSPTDLKG